MRIPKYLSHKRYIWAHILCAAAITWKSSEWGSEGLSPLGIFASYAASFLLVLFVVIPFYFLMNYLFFRVLCREKLEEVFNERDAAIASNVTTLTVLVSIFMGSLQG